LRLIFVYLFIYISGIQRDVECKDYKLTSKLYVKHISFPISIIHGDVTER